MRLGPLALLALASALAGCAGEPEPFPEGTGLHGRVEVGPTCPVQTWPPDPNCNDRPLAARFEVARSEDGDAVATFESGADGAYTVAVPAGTYWVRHVPEGSPLPTCPTMGPYTVADGASTQADIECDSGIR